MEKAPSGSLPLRSGISFVNSWSSPNSLIESERAFHPTIAEKSRAGSPWLDEHRVGLLAGVFKRG